uniref:Uncharacterized protein n=1 Tax=Lactuca sativa TaxID=4236 RepID=A0A9R1W906_LACSA|nr:hypothetical protein LSAT_V11C300134280 [Lactuca sativa]
MRGWAAQLTFKVVVGIVLRKFIPRLNTRKMKIFRGTPFETFISMPISNGDPMFCHLLMLHEVVARTGRFRFELRGGLRFGPYFDVINTKFDTKYILRDRLFPNVTDENLRLKDIKDYIKGPEFLTCGDDDAVSYDEIQIRAFSRYNDTKLRIVFGIIHRFLRDHDNVASPMILKYTVTGFHLPFQVWILETFLKAVYHTANENNIPRVVQATNIEIKLPFYMCYLDWTFNRVESPLMQQSPTKQRSPSPQPSHVREAYCITTPDNKLDNIIGVNDLAAIMKHYT